MFLAGNIGVVGGAHDGGDGGDAGDAGGGGDVSLVCSLHTPRQQFAAGFSEAVPRNALGHTAHMDGRLLRRTSPQT